MAVAQRRAVVDLPVLIEMFWQEGLGLRHRVKGGHFSFGGSLRPVYHRR